MNLSYQIFDFPGGQLSTQTIDFAVNRLWVKLARGIRFRGLIDDLDAAQRILRAGLLQFAMGDPDGAQSLVEMLNSSDTFDTALAELVRSHFILPNCALD